MASFHRVPVNYPGNLVAAAGTLLLAFLTACGSGTSAPPPPPPALSLTSTSLTFDAVLVGNESSPKVETLTNTGGLELAINSMVITGTDASDFGQAGACGSSLGAGASCTLNVTFTPKALGQRSASITITSDGAGSPQVISLNGVGLDPGTNATLSPTSLSFGDEIVGSTSPAQSVMLNNYGATTLSITSITASSNFGETNTCNSTLASGESCAVNVTFAPGSAGSLNGTLSCVDSAADSPQTVALSGIGVSQNCIPQGGACYGRSANCCPAPRGHHSYCSNPTGWGTCVEQ